jgi:hypothetical protein
MAIGLQEFLLIMQMTMVNATVPSLAEIFFGVTGGVFAKLLFPVFLFFGS